ncbi:DUF6049 family protein [Nocardioides marmoribigeumensis]|uniref:Secreted protein n=1 Tax=Nocardioides marmoribigeumensis TaxID=433649 RepID=A0ABU2BVM0_9ACTN|nr:DUF6049 family protein [Nocardioides marmoribigeumensis]MDR7362316.1 hypothetical protein [Nocardioides marmoribigeumensis]
MTRPRLPLLLAAGVLASLTALAGPVAAPDARAAPSATPAPTPGPATGPATSGTPTATPGSPGSTGDPSASPADPGEGPEPATADRPPLEVRLESIQPAVLPRRGALRVSGTVTNRTTSTWTELQAYLAVSPDPLTTPEALAAAQAEPAGRESDFGRLVDPGLFVDLPDLPPGGSAAFRLVVPRDRLGLPETPGVYRIGVHALGSEEGLGRVAGADGRARTFLTQLPTTPGSSPDPTPLALVMQLRNHVVRAPTGELEFLRGWRRTLAPDGRLGRLLALSDTTAGFPLSWVLDPAVVEAAGTVAEGNPRTELGGRAYDGVDDVTDGGTSGDQGASGSPEASGAPETAETAESPASPSSDGSASPTTGPDAVAAQGRADAAAWLDGLRDQAALHPTFSVPYGDLDVAAAARAGDTTTIDRSVRTGLDTLAHYTVSARPLVAPVNGALKGWMLDRVPPTVPAVLSDAVLPTLDGTVYRRGDRPVVLFSRDTLRPDADAAEAAGVDPTASTALGLRQRLLAVTAVRSLTGDDRPLVAMLPSGWDPGPAWQRSAFFAGLDVPWIAATGLGDVAASVTDATPQPDDRDFLYPPGRRRAELPVRIVEHARDTTHAGALLDDTLVDDDATGPRIGRQALLSASYFSRRRPAPADRRLSAIEARVDHWLRQVRVAAPPFVISSSEEGSFLVPVTNNLDQRVRVALRARVDGPGLEVSADPAADLAPGTRRPFKMRIRSTRIGVHTVDLDLVTDNGEKLYDGPQVPVRTSKVGLVVWVVMGVAGAVFLAAIVVRIVRRVRRRRRTPGPVLRRRA